MLPTEFVHLVKRLQRRKLKSEKLTVNRCQVMAKAHMAGELKRINKISTKYYTETKDRASICYQTWPPETILVSG
jgi:hypothetical protein